MPTKSELWKDYKALCVKKRIEKKDWLDWRTSTSAAIKEAIDNLTDERPDNVVKEVVVTPATQAALYREYLKLYDSRNIVGASLPAVFLDSPERLIKLAIDALKKLPYKKAINIQRLYPKKELDLLRKLDANFKDKLKKGNDFRREYIIKDEDIIDAIKTQIKDIYSKGQMIFKVNIEVSYEIQNVETNEKKVFNGAFNSRAFKMPMLIMNKADLENVLEKVNDDVLYKVFIKKRPDTKWSFVKYVEAKVIIWQHFDIPIGKSDKFSPAPERHRRSRYLKNLASSYNQCLFACIAYHQNQQKTDKVSTEAKKLYEKYYGKKGSDDFKGVTLSEIDAIEKCFQLPINIYCYTKDLKLEVLRISTFESKEKPLRLCYVKENNHFMYISKFDSLVGKYTCPKCQQTFDDQHDYVNHTRYDCSAETIIEMPKKPKLVIPHENIVQSLAKVIKVPDPFYDYIACFDFESILKPIHETTAKTITNQEHLPLSCAATSNIPGFDKVVYYSISNGDDIVSELLNYLEKCAQKASQLTREKFKVLLEKRLNKTDTEKLNKFCDNLPIFGFNSGKYDLNLIKKEIFAKMKYSRDKKIDVNVIKRTNQYLMVNSGGKMFLDTINYLPPTFNLDKYIQDFTGYKTKMKFPYTYVTCVEKLDDFIFDLDASAFDSELRVENQFFNESEFKKQDKMTKTEFIEAEFRKWQGEQLRKDPEMTLNDYLASYNKSDVEPYLKAIIKHRDIYREQGLDLTKNGFTISSIAEFNMYRKAFEGYDKVALCEDEDKKKRHILLPTKPFVQKRIQGYNEQDKLRGFDQKNTLSAEDFEEICKREKYECYYGCGRSFNETEKYGFCLDRLDSSKGHIKENCVLCCDSCNKSKKDMDPNIFKSRVLDQKKMSQFARRNKMIWSTDNRDIYDLHKKHLRGGASVIFKRHQELGKPINEHLFKDAPICKSILGLDANALYPHCLKQDLPCGIGRFIEIEPKTVVDDILTGKLFGFLECEIEIPEKLRGKEDEFAKCRNFPPIFRNVVIDTQKDRGNIGSFMMDFLDKNEKKIKTNYLVSAYTSGLDYLIFTPYLITLVETCGAVIKNVKRFIEYERGSPFREFIDDLCKQRKQAKIEENSINDERAKLNMNSSIGRSGMDRSKHTLVKYLDDEQTQRVIISPRFEDLVTLNDDCHEVQMTKRKCLADNPIHLQHAIYDLSKAHMVEFYYSFLSRFIDARNFQLLTMDTDSFYFAFAEKTIEGCVRKELLNEFQQEKKKWLVPEKRNFEKTKDGKYIDLEYLTKATTTGLFKLECECISLTAPCAKTIYREKIDAQEKISAKGAQKRQNIQLLSKENFEKAIELEPTEGKNISFRLDKNTQTIKTQTVHKQIISPIYLKMKVLKDGINTFALY